MNNGFFTKEIEQLSKELKSINNQMNKENKIFLKKEGNKLKQKTLSLAKSRVKKKTGKYFKSIKRGKIYTYDNALAIRVYSTAPHAHLIENGHIYMDNGEEKFLKGNYVFEDSFNEFENTYLNDCENHIDKLVKDL